MAVTEQVVVDIESKYDDSGLKALRKSASESNNELSKLESTAGASISSFGELSATIGITLVASLGAFIAQSIQAGATFKDLKDNFAGTSEDIELFRKATAGTVSEGDLIKLSNQATDLGLSLHDQTLLFNLAENAGDAYGGGIEENFNKIISATEGSAKGLKAIGISTRDFKEKLEELEKQQKIVIEDLDSEEQLRIKLKAIYELTGVSIDDVNTKTKNTADIIEGILPMLSDLTASFGSGIVEAMDKTITKAGEIDSKFKDLKLTTKDLGFNITNFLTNTINKWVEFGELIKKYSVYLSPNAWIANTMADMFVEGITPPQQQTEEGLVIRIPEKEEKDKIRKKKTDTGNKINTKSLKEIIPEIKFNFDNEISRNSLEKLSQAVYDNLILMPLMRTFKIGTQPVGTVTQDPFKEWLDSFMNQPTDLYTVDGLDIESIYSDSQKVLSNVQSLFSMLDTGTDTFINKLLQFFGMIQKGFEAIGLIKSIVGIVTGGIGARPGINNSQSAIYIGMNVNTLELYRTGREQFNRLQNKTRVF